MNALAEPRQLTERFLKEWLDALPPEAAAALAAWRPSDELSAELSAFAERAGEAQLSREQADGYDEYRKLASMASLLRTGAARKAGTLPRPPLPGSAPVAGPDRVPATAAA